jgi:ATP-dependent Lon protease
VGESATALVVLDEVDKAADLTRNSPPVQSALLPLLDREEARRWRDNYLQVECDLSSLLWVMTCNDLTWLSVALRSRLRIVEIRHPSQSELYSVVDCAVRDLEAEWRLPPGVLKGMPISALLPRGLSSLRDLQRGVARAASLWINSTSTERH